MSNFLPKDHTFVICAYKESEYLEECIKSLFSQSVKTNIIMATSTPNDYILNMGEKYDIPVFVNHGESGIAGDWNFALSKAETLLITIAHQDDIYEPNYASVMLKKMNKARNPILFSSAYGEIRDGKKVYSNKLLNIKKVLIVPSRMFPSSVKARRLSLSFGDSISCPTVTYVRDVILRYPFVSGLRAALDWQEWEKLSKLSGEFVYSSLPLMCHRIHAESETSHIIGENSRQTENLEMFQKFWPKPVANFINNLYSASEKSNEV